jgi:hypothetical protein
MPKQTFERRKVLDPVVADLLDGMKTHQDEAQLPRHQRLKKARERAKIQARREQRATYDLPPTIRTSIKDLAEEQSLPISQLVTLALIRFLKDYSNGQIDLGKYKKSSRSPKYDWVLDLSKEMPDAQKKK